MQQMLGWRAMHSQGRGLNSVMINQLGDDIDTYTLREAEFSCNAIVGFNFGDGHLHDRRMIEAVQKRCRFAPGEFIVVWAESEALGTGRQDYLVIDAAVGVVERGSWAVKDAVERAAVAAERPDRDRGHLPHARLRARQPHAAAVARERAGDGMTTRDRRRQRAQRARCRAHARRRGRRRDGARGRRARSAAARAAAS